VNVALKGHLRKLYEALYTDIEEQHSRSRTRFARYIIYIVVLLCLCVTTAALCCGSAGSCSFLTETETITSAQDFNSAPIFLK